MAKVPTCSSCPHFSAPRDCPERGRMIDPDRFLCDQHPMAPSEARDGLGWMVSRGDSVVWFFALGDPHQEEGVVVDAWCVEDVAGVPLAVSAGWHGQGSAFLRIDLPGGLGLTCGDALALASATNAWRDAARRVGPSDLRKRLHVVELFTCFTISLGLADQVWDGERTRAGWPAITSGCPCRSSRCSQ